MTTADATIAQLKHETKALLEAVNTGQRLRITRRGRPVAWLIPHTAAQPEPMGEQAAAAARRDQVRKLMALARRAPAHGENPVLAERKRRGL